MNRRHFLMSSIAASSAVAPSFAVSSSPGSSDADAAGVTRAAVLLVDTDRVTTAIDRRIYGHFLEHINHSVVDGLFAEQIRGCGFEGEDFKTYWEPFSENGSAECVDVEFRNGKKSVRLQVEGGRAGIRQGRLFMDAGHTYDGSLWVKHEAGSPQLTLRVISSKGDPIASAPLAVTGSGWQEVHYSFSSAVRETQASVEIAAAGRGTLLLDFVSMMRADVRRDGMLRPDLLQAVRDLAPPFIRWPGGSFASTYKWKDGIGRHVARRYHPNTFWGGYSDYYGFGTEEFLGLCRKLNSEPLIVLAAPGTGSEQVQYAMDWVHYLNDPPTTEMGRLRAANGHPEPYGVRYFQIDNEPMNNGFTPEKYAEIVNVYGSRLRAIAPQARIVACGQKRSNDMVWSQKVIDLAGKNFDVLGVHNYEYEPGSFETGLRRIRDSLSKLRDYVRASAHPRIEIGVLEWNLSRTYDWRAGLHAAGSLMLYEELSPSLTMSCPALLMRNTTDDPTWTSFIYHDHVSWFPGCAYPVEKLFREHYAERRLASTSGAFRDVPDRRHFFDEISTMRPDDWMPGTVDAIATGSADGRRIVIKAVNYGAERTALLMRLQGATVPGKAVATLHTISAGLTDSASLDRPNAIAPVSRAVAYAKDLTVDLDPYTVAVLEIRAE
uniref:non-reducing end alpha-L-arabinofuranosidase n=1 Tax=Solibacter usitatus (strain Ellin6076) TaxID=234267 RepID=Q026H9_SOLUE